MNGAKWYRAVYRELGTEEWYTLRNKVYSTTAPPRAAITQHKYGNERSNKVYEYKLLFVDEPDWHEV